MNSSAMLLNVLSSIVPLTLATAIASIVSTATWPVKAFVEATPISGPTCIYVPACVALAMLEPMAFTIPYMNAPFLFASSTAARVSAVSPLCDMATTTSSGVMTGLRYLNSEAYSTSTGTRQRSSISCFPISPACHDVPHATIMKRFASSISLVWSCTARRYTLPGWLLDTCPLMQFSKHSGCSNISFSIKCSYPPFSICPSLRSTVCISGARRWFSMDTTSRSRFLLITAMFPSSRYTTLSVYSTIGVASLPRKNSSLPIPTTSGLCFLAAIIWSGLLLSSIAMA